MPHNGYAVWGTGQQVNCSRLNFNTNMKQAVGTYGIMSSCCHRVTATPSWLTVYCSKTTEFDHLYLAALIFSCRATRASNCDSVTFSLSLPYWPLKISPEIQVDILRETNPHFDKHLTLLFFRYSNNSIWNLSLTPTSEIKIKLVWFTKDMKRFHYYIYGLCYSSIVMLSMSRSQRQTTHTNTHNTNWRWTTGHECGTTEFWTWYHMTPSSLCYNPWCEQWSDVFTSELTKQFVLLCVEVLELLCSLVHDMDVLRQTCLVSPQPLQLTPHHLLIVTCLHILTLQHTQCYTPPWYSLCNTHNVTHLHGTHSVTHTMLHTSMVLTL